MIVVLGKRQSTRPRARRGVLLTAAIGAAITAASCAGGSEVAGPPDPLPIASIQVTPGADTLLAIGRTRTFTATARTANGATVPNAPIRWRSSDTLIARVDSLTGVVTAVRGGRATISAQSGSATGSGTVSIIQIVATVSVSPATVTLTAVGGTQSFAAEARDSGNVVIQGTRFLWTSSNPAVATIDSIGTATIVGAGETMISASGRGVPAFARLSVTQAASQLVFTIEPADVRAGDAFATALEVEVRDANGARVRDARVPVTLALATDPSGAATLAGSRTVQSVAGIATFAGNWIDRAATGFRLRVTAAGMTPDTSAAFTVRAATVSQVTTSGAIPREIGIPRSIFVNLEDRFGNFVDTTLTISVSATNPAGTLGGGVRSSVARRLSPGGFVLDSVTTTRAGTFELGVSASRPGGGSPPLFATPQAARATAGFTSISLGKTHACGIATGGVLCWGSNSSGQFGFAPTRGLEDSIPALIGNSWGNEPLQQIVALDDGTCGLATSGRAYCWGQAAQWPSGPITGTGPGGAVLTSITGSTDHVCGLTAAGTAHCWGDGTLGQLGNGGLVSSTGTAVTVTGSGAGNLVFTGLSAGISHTCGVTTVGRVYCWGDNSTGALGDSTQTQRTLPTQVAGSGTGTRVFSAIEVGGSASCARNAAGQLLCWGFNYTSASGPNLLVPTVIFASTIVDFSVGGNHICAISSGGGAACLGRNQSGEVGPTAVEYQTSPVGLGLNGRFAQRVWTGERSTCVLTTDGVFCVGRNLNGMLGIGSTAHQIVRDPTRIIH